MMPNVEWTQVPETANRGRWDAVRVRNPDWVIGQTVVDLRDKDGAITPVVVADVLLGNIHLNLWPIVVAVADTQRQQAPARAHRQKVDDLGEMTIDDLGGPDA